jgi:hypothetical protein
MLLSPVSMRVRLFAAAAAVATAVVFSGWLLAAASSGGRPRGDYNPERPATLVLSGPDAAVRRSALLRAASPGPLPPDSSASAWSLELPPGHPLTAPQPACRFLADAVTGTSAKFECVLDGGEVIKVKYGRNAEIHAEAAATRLLALLGYPADRVAIAPRLRCHGCPRFPFLTMKLLSLASAAGILSPYGYEGRYTDFEWVAVERRFPAPAIETSDVAGWAWWELKDSLAPRAEIDALRLLAVFLAHWDNKADNQRLVCVDPAPSAAGGCTRALLMIQDVGATFGPAKVNLAGWRDLPIWTDANACVVSMRHLPSHGATFPDARISEEGRLLLSQRLARLSDADVRTMFAEARFPQFYAATAERRDLDAWTAAFRSRVDQIANAGPCPSVAPSDGSTEG